MTRKGPTSLPCSPQRCFKNQRRRGVALILFASIAAFSSKSLLSFLTDYDRPQENNNDRYGLNVTNAELTAPQGPPPSAADIEKARAEILSMQKGASAGPSTDGNAAVMHTFFHILPHGDSELDELETLRAWSDLWRGAGWEPRILTVADAERHPRYEKYLERINAIPLGPNPEYDRVCYLRWLALASAGGGWMSDYDTIPLDFPPSGNLPNGGKCTWMEFSVPSLAAGAPEEFDAMLDLMIGTAEEAVASRDVNGDLFSDMMALQRIEKTYGRRSDKFIMTIPPRVVQVDQFLRESGWGKTKCRQYQYLNVAIHVSHSGLKSLGLGLKDRAQAMRAVQKAYFDRCQRLR